MLQNGIYLFIALWVKPEIALETFMEGLLNTLRKTNEF